MDKVKQEYAQPYLLSYIERWNAAVEHENDDKMIELLSREYNTWCIKNDMPVMSADELLIEIRNTKA